MRESHPRPDNLDPTRCAACNRDLSQVSAAEVIVPTRYTVTRAGRIEVTGYHLYLVCESDDCIRRLVANKRDLHELAIEEDLTTLGVSLHDYRLRTA